MKISISRTLLAEALAAAAAIVPARGVRPSLKNCRVNALADGTVIVEATDMETSLRIVLRAEKVEQPEDLLLPAGMLAGIVSECAGDQVEIETTGTKAKVLIGRDAFEVLGMVTDDFPDVPAMTEGPVLKMPAEDLARMIELTVYAAARDQGRYAINGVKFALDGARMDMVATDGRRLAIARRTLNAESYAAEALGESGLIAPVGMVKLLHKLAVDAGENASIKLAKRGNKLVATDGVKTYASLLVEGIFPNYQQVIPKGLDKEARVHPEHVLAGLRKASYLVSEESHAVGFEFGAGELKLHARAPEKGTALVHAAVRYHAEPVKVTLNPDYLSDALKCFEDDDVLALEMRDARTPVVVRSGNDFTYVLMPVNEKDA